MSSSASSGEETSLAWACQGMPPTSDEVAQRGVPACLEIVANSATPKPLPSRSLCLLGSSEEENDAMNNDNDGQSPPVYCYQDNREPGIEEYYFWWSPCTKCGTAWRLFDQRKNDESWYKLPTTTEPSPMEVPLTSLKNTEESEMNWLGWDDGDWMDVDLVIRPCQTQNSSSNNSSVDPVLPPQCFIPTSATSISDSFGWNPTWIVLPILGSVIGIVCLCGCLKFGCRGNKTGRGGGFVGGMGGGMGGGGGGGC